MPPSMARISFHCCLKCIENYKLLRQPRVHFCREGPQTNERGSPPLIPTLPHKAVILPFNLISHVLLNVFLLFLLLLHYIFWWRSLFFTMLLLSLSLEKPSWKQLFNSHFVFSLRKTYYIILEHPTIEV